MPDCGNGFFPCAPGGTDRIVNCGFRGIEADAYAGNSASPQRARRRFINEESVGTQNDHHPFAGGVRRQFEEVLTEKGLAPGEDQHDLGIDERNLIDEPDGLLRR